MKTENMTFSEALEAMKQGHKVRKKDWSNLDYLVLKNGKIINNYESDWTYLCIELPIINNWEIYNEPNPEPKFEIGELVMMRDRIDSKWFPEHFAHYEPKKEVPYMAISGRDYVQCAKFDKDIVFTNKPAKL